MKAAEPLAKQIISISVLGVLFILVLVRQQGAQVVEVEHGRLLDANDKFAKVRLSIDELGVLKFSVDLGPIPMNTEVTANFIAPEIYN
jgi:hypothetical protein